MQRSIQNAAFSRLKTILNKNWQLNNVVYLNFRVLDFIYEALFYKDKVKYEDFYYFRPLVEMHKVLEIIMKITSAFDSHIHDENPDKFLSFVKDLLNKNNIKITFPL